MTAKPKKAKTSAKGLPPPPPPMAWWWQPGTWLCAATLGGIIAGLIWLPPLLPDLKQKADYQFRLENMKISAPSAWVPASLPSQVMQAAQLPETVSLLEPKLCEKLALAWEHHPWVKKVNSVQITRDANVLMDVEYRTPIAFIEVPRGLYPVDVDGILLPPTDFTASDLDRLPHIRGVKTMPQSGLGSEWGDPVVQASTQLLAVLVPDQNIETYWKRFGFNVLVVPETDPARPLAEQLIFEIQTAGGSRVLWGKGPGEDKLEPTSSVKLARLQDYVNTHGSLEGAEGPQLIDIRPFRVIAVKPLREQQFR